MSPNDLAVWAQLEKWAKFIGGCPWGADRGKPRIYMRSRKDIKIFFGFPDSPTGDESDLLGGATLVILIDECGQPPNWYAAQRRVMMRSQYRASLILAALHAGDEVLARDIADREGPVTAAESDAASGELLNGRIVEARTVLGL